MSKTKKRKLKPKISGTLPRVLKSFQPYVAEWFIRTFNAPSPAQKKAWPAIRRGDNTLLLAPTGSGKTLAAFMCAIVGNNLIGVNSLQNMFALDKTCLYHILGKSVS